LETESEYEADMTRPAEPHTYSLRPRKRCVNKQVDLLDELSTTSDSDMHQMA